MTNPSLTPPELVAEPPAGDGPQLHAEPPGSPRPAAAAETLPRPDGAGVLLSRLLELGRLTPLQAVTVAADVLTGWAGEPAVLRPEHVRIGPDGRARPETARAGAEPPDERPAPDATAVLDALAEAAHRAAPHPGAVAHLAALDRATRSLREADAADRAETATALVAAAGPDADAARRELARLVAAATGQPMLRPAAPVQVVRPVPAHRPVRRERLRPAALARAVLGRTWRWAVSLAVLAIVLAVELALLQDKINRDVAMLLEAGRTDTVDTSAAEPQLPPVDPPAPAAAGPVTAVGLRALQPCTPGADCEVGLRVSLTPLPEAQPVSWTFHVVDRCTGATTRLPGGTLTAPAGSDRIDAVDTVTLPPGPATAVLAVTATPAEAASDPVPVPADGGTCTPTEPVR